MKEDEKTSKDKQREERLNEIKRMSEQAENESNEIQIPLFPDQENLDFGFNVDDLKNSQDPKKSHKIYYSIQRLIIDNLPKGIEQKKLREWIYEEKNVFINQGHEKDVYGRRGSDGRMAFIDSHLVTALDIVTEWVKNGAEPTDLYEAFYDKNKECGYRK